MKIMGTRFAPSFKRALSTREIRDFNHYAQEAREELGTKTSTLTMFDFSFPQINNNSGIGTTFSDKSVEVMTFYADVCGFDTIQLAPQGEISNDIRSPYSSTNFSLGSHLIDLDKLTTEDYGQLLSKDDIEYSDYNRKTKKQNGVDYDAVLDKDTGKESMLRLAYDRFKNLPDFSPLKQEFYNFISPYNKKTSYWLERDSLFEAAAVANNSPDLITWNETDKYLFEDENNINQSRIEELKQVEDEYGNNVVEYNEFKQFIASKQQDEMRHKFHHYRPNKGYEVYGDCQIGFSQKDVWAHRSAFYDNGEGRMFGCAKGGNEFTCWSPAINFEDLDGEAGELLRQKFSTFYDRYDGVRIDAAWQFVNPTIVSPYLDRNNNPIKDNDGNQLGYEDGFQPENITKIRDIITSEADKHGKSREKIKLEMLDGVGKAGKSLKPFYADRRNKEVKIIDVLPYFGTTWALPSYQKSSKAGDWQKPFEVIPGTHDDITTKQMAQEIYDSKNGKAKAGVNKELRVGQYETLKKEFNITDKELNSPEKIKDYINALLYTPGVRYNAMTITDVMGSNKRINIPNTQAGNWEANIKPSYQEDYFRAVSDGKGFNYPDALAKALKLQNHGKPTYLSNMLENFANILREKETYGKPSPMTIEDANRVIDRIG